MAGASPSETPRERAPARVRESLGNLRKKVGPKVAPAMRKTAGFVSRGLRNAPKAGVKLARGLGQRLGRIKKKSS